MLIYRYEKPDGGGPFCTRDGYLRNNIELGCIDDGLLSGCTSLSELQSYWKGQQNYRYYLTNCILAIYDIPEPDVKMSKSHVLFPKQYSPIIKKCIDYP